MRNSVEKQKMVGAAPYYFANYEWNNRTREKNKTRLYFSDFFSFFRIYNPVFSSRIVNPPPEKREW